MNIHVPCQSAMPKNITKRLRSATNAEKAAPREARLRVWIEPDNVANVRMEIARNGRTIQGEANCILRDYYQSKWDGPVSVTTAQRQSSETMQAHVGKWHESPAVGALIEKTFAERMGKFNK
jgi:Na+-translocating ferredoxin:NAD+ oxidoreductase RnfG subunit